MASPRALLPLIVVCVHHRGLVSRNRSREEAKSADGQAVRGSNMTTVSSAAASPWYRHRRPSKAPKNGLSATRCAHGLLLLLLLISSCAAGEGCATNVTTLAGDGIAQFTDETGRVASFDYPTGVSWSPDGTEIAVADRWAGTAVVEHTFDSILRFCAVSTRPPQVEQPSTADPSGDCRCEHPCWRRQVRIRRRDRHIGII